MIADLQLFFKLTLLQAMQRLQRFVNASGRLFARKIGSKVEANEDTLEASGFTIQLPNGTFLFITAAHTFEYFNLDEFSFLCRPYQSEAAFSASICQERHVRPGILIDGIARGREPTPCWLTWIDWKADLAVFQLAHKYTLTPPGYLKIDDLEVPTTETENTPKSKLVGIGYPGRRTRTEEAESILFREYVHEREQWELENLGRGEPLSAEQANIDIMLPRNERVVGLGHWGNKQLYLHSISSWYGMSGGLVLERTTHEDGSIKEKIVALRK